MEMSKRRNIETSTSRFRIGMISALWVFLAAPFAPAQSASDGAAGEVHPLASKEEMIRDRFDRFLDRVYSLQEQLSDTEPENAVRLERVLQRAGELGLAEQIEEISRLLRDSSSLTDALDAQDDWVADADQLLAILLARDSDNEERDKEIGRLEEYKQKLGHILEQQRGLRGAAARAGGQEEAKERADAPEREKDADWDHQEQAKQQRDLAGKTESLADQMKEDAESDKSGKGSKPESSPPGRQNLQRAQSDMNGAAESLDADKPNDATEDQDNAIAELEQAMRELDEALSQLRQEDRAETLRDLEARFRDMLSKQKAINTATVRLDEVGRDEFRRVEQLLAADLASKEEALSQQAAACEHILD